MSQESARTIPTDNVIPEPNNSPSRQLHLVDFPAVESTQIPAEIATVLNAHVVEMAPHQEGRRNLLSQMGEAAIGVIGSAINRPDPPLQIDSALLQRGSSVVLIGPNGSGKSTVFDALMDRGAYLATPTGTAAEQYGTPVHVRDKLRIARLDQEELLSPIHNCLAREVLDHAANYFKSQFPIDWEDSSKIDTNVRNDEARLRIDTLHDQITKLFDMEQFLDRKVGELSGGERTKLALFTVLLSEPDVLLVDEPTNHLDLKSVSKLAALFDAYKKAGTAIVSISHVDWFLTTAGNDGVLEILWKDSQRTLRESGARYSDYIRNPSIARTPIIAGEIEWRQRDYDYKMGGTLITTPPSFSIPDSPLQDIRMPSLRGGELVILTGDNGAGKTKLLESLLLPTGPGMPRRENGAHIAYLPQFWDETIAGGSVRQFYYAVQNTIDPFMKGSADHREGSAEKLFLKIMSDLRFGGARVGASWMERPFASLSGGEQRLLWFVAVSSMRNVDMMVLDEPTNHMDRFNQDTVRRAIQRYPGAVLLTTHDRNLLLSLAKDGGDNQGMQRIPMHLTLAKSEGTTSIGKSDETIPNYVDRMMRQARAQAARFKL